MRKMTSLLLAAGMTMALLSGCGGGTEAKETTAAQTTAAETKAERPPQQCPKKLRQRQQR